MLVLFRRYASKSLGGTSRKHRATAKRVPCAGDRPSGIWWPGWHRTQIHRGRL